MKCPRCKEAVDAGLSHCPHCRVELLAAFSDRAFEVQVRESAARSKRAAKPVRHRRARQAAWAAFAAGLCAAVFLAGLFLSRPKPLAVTPPPGWRAEPPPPGAPWSATARFTDGLSTIDLFEAGSGLDASKAAARAFDDPKSRVESSRSVVVGGVESVALQISGGRAYLPSAAAGAVRDGSLPAPQFESQPVHGELIVVPARGRTVVVRGVTGEGNAPALRRALDALCAGLRL